MSLVLGATTSAPAVPPSWFNVKDYGAVGDNSHDDTAAIQSAMNALKANVNAVTGSMGGQTLFFPPGYYKTTSTLDFTGLGQVRILGISGRSGGSTAITAGNTPATAIAYTPGNANSTACINMSGSTACTWDGVSVVSRSPNYTGTLLNLNAVAAADIFGHRLQNCRLSGFSGGELLSLAGNIEFSAENVTFESGQVRMVDPSAPAHWSNANSFKACSFVGTRTVSILNPGPQTTLMDCTFEPPSTGNVPAPILYSALGNEPAGPLTVIGCGFWDSTGTGGSWLVSTVATSGFSFIGSRLGIGPGGTFFNLSSHSGLFIGGCRFQAENGGTPNIFTPAQNITNGVMSGCHVASPVVDNHTSVFV